jgi:hypothetical protein
MMYTPGVSSATLALVLLAGPASAGDLPYLLDDQVLDQVTAGTQSDPRELAEFDFSRSTASGRTVSGHGSLALTQTSREYTLTLGDGAQQHLRSLVNINAIDAQITVLLNLNINVDSTVGTLNQHNFNQHNVNLRATDLSPPGQ